jgi:hypothetical protein
MPAIAPFVQGFLEVSAPIRLNQGLENRPRIKPSVAGCYFLPTLDKTMSDRIAMPRLILKNFLPTIGNKR